MSLRAHVNGRRISGYFEFPEITYILVPSLSNCFWAATLAGSWGCRTLRLIRSRCSRVSVDLLLESEHLGVSLNSSLIRASSCLSACCRLLGSSCLALYASRFTSSIDSASINSRSVSIHLGHHLLNMIFREILNVGWIALVSSLLARLACPRA